MSEESLREEESVAMSKPHEDNVWVRSRPLREFPGLSPVEWIEGDQERDEPEDGIALCLSGGGYRAMLFHLGALWRLNELGFLARLARVSSVSGGSIMAATLFLNWNKLQFDGSRVAQAFQDQVVAPLRRLAERTLDEKSILSGLFGSGSVSDRLIKAYRKHLYGDFTLQDFPDVPRLVINATSVQSGVLCRFSKPYMWDYRVGKIENPKLSIAVAVGASSAFPPFLSPATLKWNNTDFVPSTGRDLQFPPFTTDMVLTDGGVYDNLGLETAWKRYRTILVSDGGGQIVPDPKPKRDWLQHGIRVASIIDNQVRALRKRQLISSYTSGIRQGAYWGIRSDIQNYKLPDALPAPLARTLELAALPTRLKCLPQDLQQRLMNWGYTVCDAAIRKHVDSTQLQPAAHPYPKASI